MSTRYVWDKYNVNITNPVYKDEVTLQVYHAVSDTKNTIYASSQYNVSNGSISLISPVKATWYDNPSDSLIHVTIGDTTTYPYITFYGRDTIGEKQLYFQADPGYTWTMQIDDYMNIALLATYLDPSNFITYYGKVYRLTVGDSEYSKGTYISLISNINNTYPSDNYSGQYWYTYKGSDNIDPTAITYPSSIKGGQVITLTATKSGSIKYGSTITYTYEVQLNGGSWISIGDSTSLTKSYTVPAGTTTFKARVKVRDNMGFTSSTYATGNQVNVINNSAPTISGSDKDLGSFSYLLPYIEYVINDADGNTVSVSIQLDSQSIYSGTAVLGKTEFIVFPDWDSLSNGSHTITITANDGQGGVTTRTYTFSKSVNANLISRERWRRLNEGNVYDVIYFETAADVVTTNNGKYLRDRINAIRSRVAALKGTSDAALAAMDSSIVTERLHMKTDSGYNVKYLDTKSQYVKIGSQTVEEVLTQIESDITALKG